MRHFDQKTLTKRNVKDIIFLRLMKKIFCCFSLVIMTFRNIFSDVINTSSFINADISTKYKNSGMIKQKIVSPDNQYTAIYEDFKFIIITNKDNEIIFKYKWDDEIIAFPSSDTLYLYEWSENTLWFYAYVPSEIIYIAKAEINNKKLLIYAILATDLVREYTIDTNNDKLYYSNYFGYNDPDEISNLYQYDMVGKQETIIISRKTSDGEFNPQIINGELKFDL